MAGKNETSDAASRKAEAAAAAAARDRVVTGSNEATNEASPSRLMARAGSGGSRDVVLIGCKLPHGLIIEIDELGQTDEGKPVWKGTGRKVTLKGANSSSIIGGFGLTEVDADFWEEWSQQKKKFAPLAAGLIFVEATRERAIAHAIDSTEATTGFEPLNPDKPGPGLQRVPEAEQRAAAGFSGNG